MSAFHPLRTLARSWHHDSMVRTGGFQRLTERQKEILRLLLDGYDAKSAARQLGISFHTVHEHLREARRHLGVSSSREAARVLREAESGTPNTVRPTTFGVVHSQGSNSWFGNASRNLSAALAGVALMILVTASLIALSIAKGRAESNSPPRVIATKPLRGATISPGPFVIEVTFDRPMLDGNFSFVQISPETYPNCEPRPNLSPDARTFILNCRAEAGRSYEVWFNRPPYMNFKSLTGAPAEPNQLRFRSKPR